MLQASSRSLSALFIIAIYGVLAPAVVLAKPAAPWVGKTLSGKQCAGGQPTTGPFDYLNMPANAGMLRVVEENHFNRNVETLAKGMSSTPMGDIDFTLLAFPNHHRALQSAMNFSMQRKQWPADSKGHPAECYLQRAINFSPRDPVPVKLYGYYMHRKGKLEVALQANQRALTMQPADVMLRYNTALILVDLKRYDEALALAQPLYKAGLTLPGLKNKLVKAGVWEYSPEQVAAYIKALEAQAAKKAAAAAADPNAPGTQNPATEQDSPGESTPESHSGDQ
ncbi:MAG: hypothetical protein R3E54_04750 [Halioglobus sp.]